MVTVGPTSGMEQVKQTVDASSVQSNPALSVTSLPDNSNTTTIISAAPCTSTEVVSKDSTINSTNETVRDTIDSSTSALTVEGTRLASYLKCGTGNQKRICTCGHEGGCDFSKKKYYLCVHCQSILKSACKKKNCVKLNSAALELTRRQPSLSGSFVLDRAIQELISKFPVGSVVSSGTLYQNAQTNEAAADLEGAKMLGTMQLAISNVVKMLRSQLTYYSSSNKRVIELYNTPSALYNLEFLALQKQTDCYCSMHAINALFGVLVDNSDQQGLWFKGLCMSTTVLPFSSTTDTLYTANRRIAAGQERNGYGPILTCELEILDPAVEGDRTRALYNMRAAFTNAAANPTEGLPTEVMYQWCLSMNPRSDEKEIDKIFLGVLPLASSKCTDFSQLMEAIEPGNAAIIFYVKKGHNMGHYVTVWTIEDNSGKLLYCFHDAIVGLIGADTVDQMGKNINASKSSRSQYCKIFRGDAYDRTLFIFSLPLSQSVRGETIRQVCVRINKLGNHFIENFMGVTDSKLVKLPHNFMKFYLTEEDIRESVVGPSVADLDMLDSQWTKAKEVETEYDSSENDSSENQRLEMILKNPYRYPASDEKSIASTGTSAQSNELRTGDYVVHRSTMFYQRMVSQVVSARPDKDSAGRVYPNITLLSGHSLKSDDTIRKLVAKFTSDNKWDSSSGTAHMVYEFTWCDNEVAGTCVTNEVSSMVDAFDNVQDDNVQDDTDSNKIDESNNDDTFWGISKSQTSRNKYTKTRKSTRTNKGINNRLLQQDNS